MDVVLSAIRFRKEGKPAQGTWKHVYVDGKGVRPHMWCIFCGTEWSMDPDRIRDDGLIKGAIACTVKDCDFQGYVLLEGWER